MANSKIYQAFSGKMTMLQQHLELSDLALRIANNQCVRKKDPEKMICDILDGTENHNHLSYPATGREIGRVFSLSRSKLNEQAIVDIYRFFSWYISHTIRAMAQKEPIKIQSLLANKNSTISYVDIVKAGSYETIIENMAKSVFRTLEELRSTSKMLEKIISLTNIAIEENLLKDALFYLDIRHLIIHNDTKADDKFEENNRNLVSIHPINKKIGMNYDLSTRVLEKVKEFCKEIDCQLIAKGLLDPQ